LERIDICPERTRFTKEAHGFQIEGKKMRRSEDEKMKRNKNINHFRDLEVYRRAFEAAMRIFQTTKGFPAEEKYSLVDQIRRASRSVCANTCPVK